MSGCARRLGPGRSCARDRLSIVRVGWPAERCRHSRGSVAVDVDVLDGEAAFAAHGEDEGEPPAEQRPDAVAPAGEEADVDEQPGDPAEKAAEVQLPGGDDGAAAGDI